MPNNPRVINPETFLLVTTLTAANTFGSAAFQLFQKSN